MCTRTHIHYTYYTCEDLPLKYLLMQIINSLLHLNLTLTSVTKSKPFGFKKKKNVSSCFLLGGFGTVFLLGSSQMFPLGQNCQIFLYVKLDFPTIYKNILTHTQMSKSTQTDTLAKFILITSQMNIDALH